MPAAVGLRFDGSLVQVLLRAQLSFDQRQLVAVVQDILQNLTQRRVNWLLCIGAADIGSTDEACRVYLFPLFWSKYSCTDTTSLPQSD